MIGNQENKNYNAPRGKTTGNRKLNTSKLQKGVVITSQIYLPAVRVQKDRLQRQLRHLMILFYLA